MCVIIIVNTFGVKGVYSHEHSAPTLVVMEAMTGGCCRIGRGFPGEMAQAAAVSVHGKGFEGGSAEWRSAGTGVGSLAGCADWSAWRVPAGQNKGTH